MRVTSSARRVAPVVAEGLESRRLLSAVTGFTLINSQTDQPIKTISNGETINLANYPAGKLNVRVNTDNSGIKSVKLGLDSNPNFAVENFLPYALFGDRPGNDFRDGTFSVGNHTLKATPFSRAGGTGTAGTARQISFKVVNQPTTPPPTTAVAGVVRFALMNADSDTEIQTLSDGQHIKLEDLPTRNLNVLAILGSGQARSVKFGLDANSNFNIEGTSPYALFGDTGTDLDAGTFAVGSHTLKAQAFAGTGAAGTAGTARQIQFFIDEDTPAPTSDDLVVLYDDPNDADSGINDELTPVDDPATPEIDPSFFLYIEFDGNVYSGGYALANKGTTPLTLDGEIEVEINYLTPLNTNRYLGLDKTTVINETTFRNEGGYAISDLNGTAIRGIKTRTVQPTGTDTNNPGQDLPVLTFGFFQLDDPTTAQADDLANRYVLDAAGGANDSFEFNYGQGDTPAQGGGSGTVAPASRPIAPRGRR